MSALLSTEILTRQEFLTQLTEHNLIIPSGEPGLVGRGMEFERVRTAVDSLITGVSNLDSPETPRFPPRCQALVPQTGYTGNQARRTLGLYTCYITFRVLRIVA